MQKIIDIRFLNCLHHRKQRVDSDWQTIMPSHLHPKLSHLRLVNSGLHYLIGYFMEFYLITLPVSTQTEHFVIMQPFLLLASFIFAMLINAQARRIPFGTNFDYSEDLPVPPEFLRVFPIAQKRSTELDIEEPDRVEGRLDNLLLELARRNDPGAMANWRPHSRFGRR